MSDIFITPLAAGLLSWMEAFPKAKIAATVDLAPKKTKVIQPELFWLHMNVDRQQWMQNAVGQIQKNYPNAKIIVLANNPNQAESLYALSLGVLAYAHSYSPANVLLEIKKVVTSGGIWIGQDLLRRLIEVSTALVGNEAARVDEHLNLLSKREKQVALEAAKGLSNKEIARILKITERTVKAHLSATFERLGARDRLHLALMLNKKS